MVVRSEVLKLDTSSIAKKHGELLSRSATVHAATYSACTLGASHLPFEAIVLSENTIAVDKIRWLRDGKVKNSVGFRLYLLDFVELAMTIQYRPQGRRHSHVSEKIHAKIGSVFTLSS